MRIRMILIFAATMCLAQTPEPAPRLTQLRAYLSLSDAQVSSITQMIEGQRASRQDDRRQLRTTRQQLRELIRSGSTDASALGELQAELQAHRNQAREARATLRDQLLTILTPEQTAKLDTLEEAAALRREIRQAAAVGLLTLPDSDAGLGALRLRQNRARQRARQR